MDDAGGARAAATPSHTWPMTSTISASGSGGRRQALRQIAAVDQLW
ncbi:MAG: hypothetical protein HS111_04110 [Kofleriaceae bacterium]|nr:hypothetical protein [Kofleriaceae bacterium]